MRTDISLGNRNQIRRRPRSAIAYRRVSTERQGESGVGLDGQRIAIEEFARREQYEIVGWHQDIASGHGEKNVEKRPGLQFAIDQAKVLDVPLLVFDASRISRVANDVLALAGDRNIKIISVTEGAMVDSLLASSAARSQYERQKISENTRRALQQLKAEGVRLGNPTNLREAQRLGAESNRARAQVVAEKIADVLEDLADMDELTAGKIVDILNERGIKTGSGGAWTIGAVRRPLKAAREIRKLRIEDHYRSNPNYGRF